MPYFTKIVDIFSFFFSIYIKYIKKHCSKLFPSIFKHPIIYNYSFKLKTSITLPDCIFYTVYHNYH